MKKLIIVGVFVFAMALTVNVTFADTCGICGWNPCPCPDQSNTAVGVTNTVAAQANTGYNTAMGFGWLGGSVVTKDAGASAQGVNAINSNLKTGMTFGPSAQTNKAYNVENTVLANSNTGYNTAMGGSAWTGNSGSSVQGINLVNTNLKIGGGWGF